MEGVYRSPIVYSNLQGLWNDPKMVSVCVSLYCLVYKEWHLMLFRKSLTKAQIELGQFRKPFENS